MAMFHFRLKSDKKPNGTKISAVQHVKYINREKAFEKRGGCIFHSHHLPKWAHDDPKKFFQAADKYEDSVLAVFRKNTSALFPAKKMMPQK